MASPLSLSVTICCLSVVIAMEGAGETHRYTPSPPGVQCLMTPTFLGAWHSAFSSLAFWREVMTAARVQSSPAWSGGGGAERSSRMLEHRNALGLPAFMVITGRGHACSCQEHHPRDKTAGNPCRLELAEFPILEGGFLLLISSCYGIIVGIAWRNNLYNTLNWNANPAKVQVRCSSNLQVLSCLAQGCIRKKQGKSGKGRGIHYLGSALSAQGAWQCEMCLVWAQSPLGLASSRWGDIRWQYPLAPWGKRRVGNSWKQEGWITQFYSPSSSQAALEIRYTICPVAKVVNE